VTFEASAVLAHRLAVQGVGGALPIERLAEAARPGLQDGSPRSGLLSLHARVEGVGPDTWEHDDLAQVFFRASVYLIPADDFGVFTRGAHPIDAERAEETSAIADRIAAVLGPDTMRQADVEGALPDLTHKAFRKAATTGRLRVRWDARDVMISIAEPPSIPVGQARRALARRFFRYLGPATVKDFQWWIDATSDDARSIVADVEDDLTEIETPHGPMLIATDAIDLLASPPEPPDVVLLPPDDPAFLRRTTSRWLDADLSRLVWPAAPPPGVVIVEGAIVGRWRRTTKRTAVELFSPQPRETLDAVTQQAVTFPIAFDREPMVHITHR